MRKKEQLKVLERAISNIERSMIALHYLKFQMPASERRQLAEIIVGLGQLKSKIVDIGSAA